MPRSRLIRVEASAYGPPEYNFTDEGLKDLRMLSKLGSTFAEMAEHFDVSEDWLRKHLERNQQAREVRQDALARVKRRVRRNQLALSETNAQMAIWLGRQLLGQKEDHQVTHNHRHYVVGTVPNAKSRIESWQEQYAPKEALEPPRQSAVPILDAEFEELEEADVHAESDD